MDVTDARNLKALEDENAKPKKLLAEVMRDNAMLKDVALKNGDARCKTGSCGAPVQGAWREPASGVCGLGT